MRKSGGVGSRKRTTSEGSRKSWKMDPARRRMDVIRGSCWGEGDGRR